jgi:hypothetical protein
VTNSKGAVVSGASQEKSLEPSYQNDTSPATPGSDKPVTPSHAPTPIRCTYPGCRLLSPLRCGCHGAALCFSHIREHMAEVGRRLEHRA